MVLEKFLSPMNLLGTHTLSILQLSEVIMIGKYKNFKFTAFQIVAPSLKDFNYGQQFMIVSFVPCLYQNHFTQKNGYRVPLTRFRGWLAKNTTYSIVENICFNPNIASQIQIIENGYFGECLSSLLKS